MNNRTVPKRVLKVLKQVMDTSITNMYNSEGVITVAEYIDHWSGVWLDKYLLKPNGRIKHGNEFGNMMSQFSTYLKEQNEITNTKT